MAILTFTADELRDVRLQAGKQFSVEDLSDTDIASMTINGSAVDYVLEKVTIGISQTILDAKIADGTLTQAEADAFGKARDGTATDVSNFINLALKPPQTLQFRRATVFRAAGLSIPIVKKVSSESGSQIETRLQDEKWADRQANLFTRADEEISRLRDAFPDDLFVTRAIGSRRYRFFGITTRG